MSSCLSAPCLPILAYRNQLDEWVLSGLGLVGEEVGLGNWYLAESEVLQAKGRRMFKA